MDDYENCRKNICNNNQKTNYMKKVEKKIEVLKKPKVLKMKDVFIGGRDKKKSIK